MPSPVPSATNTDTEKPTSQQSSRQHGSSKSSKSLSLETDLEPVTAVEHVVISPIKQKHIAKADAGVKARSNVMDLGQTTNKPASAKSNLSEMVTYPGSNAVEFLSSRGDSFSASLPRTLTSSERRRLSVTSQSLPSREQVPATTKQASVDAVAPESPRKLRKLSAGSTDTDIVMTDVRSHATKLSSVSVVFSPKKKSRHSITMSDMLYGEKTLHKVEVTDMELKLKREIEEDEIGKEEKAPMSEVNRAVRHSLKIEKSRRRTESKERKAKLKIEGKVDCLNGSPR